MNRRWLLFSLLLIGLYQNCRPFETQSLNSANRSGGSISPLDPTPQPVVSPTAAPSPTPVRKSRFYFGANGRLASLSIDHATNQVSQAGAVNIPGVAAGWLYYDRTTQKLLAPDVNNPRIQYLSVNPATGDLTTLSTSPFISGAVHLALATRSAGVLLFGSVYNAGTFGMYSAPATLTATTSVQTVSPGAMTHSAAYDTKRGLLYVASLGTNRIMVYSVSDTALTQVGMISVGSPRTVVYDAAYDKLYLATEANPGPSFIKAYSLSYSAGVFTSTEVGSASMTASGSDIKLAPKLGYALALSRQAGQERLIGLPLNSTGAMDTSRPIFTLNLTQPLPRSLELSEDETFAVIGSNASSARALTVFRLSANSGQLQTTELAAFADAEGFLCGTNIPTY